MSRGDEEQDPRVPLPLVYFETRWRNQTLVMRLHLCWMAGDTVLHKWSRKQEHKHWSVQTECKIKSRTYLTIYAVKKKKKDTYNTHLKIPRMKSIILRSMCWCCFGTFVVLTHNYVDIICFPKEEEKRKTCSLLW